MKDVKLNSARIVLPLNRKPKLLKNWTTRERNKQAIKPNQGKTQNIDTRSHAIKCSRFYV